MQKADTARLDAEATNLLGDDAYYQHRLAQIEKAQGDIAEDLKVFIDDFLRRGYRRAALLGDEQSQNPAVLRMTFDTQLAAWLSDNVNSPLRRFRDKYIAAGDQGLPVTFQQQAADQLRGVEFLTSTHPFVRAIAALAEEKREAATRAFSVELSDRRWDAGWCLIAIALQTVQGIRPRKEILEVGINLETGETLPEDVAHEMIVVAERNGLRCDTNRAVDEAVVQAASLCESLLISALERRVALVTAENKLLLERRRDTLQRWYQGKIARGEELAQQHAHPGIRSMHAGLVKRWRTDLEVELDRLAALQSVNPMSDTKALVLVHVTQRGER
jgi:hypothetical protein